MEDKSSREMSREDLFTPEEARDIAAENAPERPEPTALERAARRVCAVQSGRSGDAGWDRLFARYPEARDKALTAEVFAGVRGGLTPTEAYQHMRLAAMQAEQLAQQSARRAVGPLAGEGGPQETDPFLAGLNHKN